MMSFVARRPVFVAILLFLGALLLPTAGQTLAQEEHFEACCKNASSGAIADTSYCNYRTLSELIDAEFNQYNPKLETGVKIARDAKNETSVNEAWADFLPCLNNGKDNRECCYASKGSYGLKFTKDCTPLCSGLLSAKDVDIKALNSKSCYLLWKPTVSCAIMAA